MNSDNRIWGILLKVSLWLIFILAFLLVKIKFGWDPMGSFISKTDSILIDSIQIESKMELLVNDTLRLEPHIFPVTASNKSLIWKIDSTTIADVDSTGLITATDKGGVCTLTITTADGSEICKTCIISVRIPVKELKVSQVGDYKGNLANGDTIYLNAKINPGNATDREVRWETTDRKIADVDVNGVVSIISNHGSCYIIATAGGVKDSFLIHPTNVSIPLKSIYLSSSRTTIQKGQTFVIKASLNPNNATDKQLEWHSEPAYAVLKGTKIEKSKYNGDNVINILAEFEARRVGNCKITAENSKTNVSASIYYKIKENRNSPEEGQDIEDQKQGATINYNMGYAFYSGPTNNGYPTKGGVLVFRKDCDIRSQSGYLHFSKGDKLKIKNYSKSNDNTVIIFGDLITPGKEKSNIFLYPD